MKMKMNNKGYIELAAGIIVVIVVIAIVLFACWLTGAIALWLVGMLLGFWPTYGFWIKVLIGVAIGLVFGSVHITTSN